MELKVPRHGRKTLDQALSEALAKIASLNYSAELRAAGADRIRIFSAAFDGNRVSVREGH